jgi:hypothetical protein
MPGEIEKLQSTDVDEIRNLMEQCDERAHDIFDKVMGLHYDAELDKSQSEDPSLPGPIGAEFIQRMIRLQRLLSESFTSLKKFC